MCVSAAWEQSESMSDRQVLLPVHAHPAYELLGACLTHLSRDCGSACPLSQRGSLPSLCPEVICSVVHSWQGFLPSFPTAVQWKQFNLLLKITGRKRTSVTTEGWDWSQQCCLTTAGTHEGGEADKFPLPQACWKTPHSPGLQRSDLCLSLGLESAF